MDASPWTPASGYVVKPGRGLRRRGDAPAGPLHRPGRTHRRLDRGGFGVAGRDVRRHDDHRHGRPLEDAGSDATVHQRCDAVKPSCPADDRVDAEVVCDGDDLSCGIVDRRLDELRHRDAVIDQALHLLVDVREAIGLVE